MQQAGTQKGSGSTTPVIKVHSKSQSLGHQTMWICVDGTLKQKKKPVRLHHSVVKQCLKKAPPLSFNGDNRKEI